MNKKNILPKLHITLKLSLTTLVCSCAPLTLQNVKPIYPTQVNTPPESPTQTINDFKIEGQKEVLDAVIAEKEMDAPIFLKDVHNETVTFWIDYFTNKDKKRFERYLANGAKYQSVIEEILLDHGLPKELYYVGLIESGYNLKARSHANAVGPWQFIKSTAVRYGLHVKDGVDERKSIHKSTRAAALFFQDLYNIFGSWELALSAYNAGEYGIIRRIREANTRDFYELSEAKSIPKETRHYVPKVLAVIKILQNPEKYNINVPSRTNPFFNTKFITLSDSYHLSQIAKSSGIEIEQIRQLNPDLTSNATPYVSNKNFLLRVPNGNYEFVKNLKSRNVASALQNNRNKIYRVQSGDSLTTIAHKFQVSILELKHYNNLKSANHLMLGQKINIPLNAINPIPESTYTIKRGDNLYSIARRNHTTVSEIMQLNNMQRKTIYAGNVIKLPQVEKTFYTVRPGDFLGRIASKFGLSIREIKRLNSLERNQIYPGQRLVVSLD